MMDDFVHLPLAGGPSGVYLLLRRGVVVYAGQSLNVFARVAQHWQVLQRHLRGLRPRASNYKWETKIVQFDAVRVKFCARERLDAEESALIKQHQPEGNTLLKEVVKPLRRDIRETPYIRDLFKRAEEREQKVNEAKAEILRPRRRLPADVARVEREFQRGRDSRLRVSLAKVSFLDEHVD